MDQSEENQLTISMVLHRIQDGDFDPLEELDLNEYVSIDGHMTHLGMFMLSYFLNPKVARADQAIDAIMAKNPDLLMSPKKGDKGSCLEYLLKFHAMLQNQSSPDTCDGHSDVVIRRIDLILELDGKKG